MEGGAAGCAGTFLFKRKRGLGQTQTGGGEEPLRG